MLLTKFLDYLRLQDTSHKVEELKVINDQNYFGAGVVVAVRASSSPLSAFSCLPAAMGGLENIVKHLTLLCFGSFQSLSTSCPHTLQPSLLCANLFSPQEHMLPLLATTLLANSTIHL